MEINCYKVQEDIPNKALLAHLFIEELRKLLSQGKQFDVVWETFDKWQDSITHNLIAYKKDTIFYSSAIFKNKEGKELLYPFDIEIPQVVDKFFYNDHSVYGIIKDWKHTLDNINLDLLQKDVQYKQIEHQGIPPEIKLISLLDKRIGECDGKISEWCNERQYYVDVKKLFPIEFQIGQ